MILRLIFMVFVLLPFVLVLIPTQFILTRLNLPYWNVLPRTLYRLCCVLFGLRVSVSGAPRRGKPVLLVANHISWADILALGSVADIIFVAKSEIKKWPFVGFMASLQKTIFVARARRTDTKRASNEMADRLADGGAVVLFAEGGSDIGTHILPFRSALVGAAQAAMVDAGAKDVMIQPVTIAYTRLQGLPVSRGDRARLAWNRSESLLHNIGEILNRGICEITICFGEPVALTKGTDRKQITRHCHAEVRRTHNALNRGTMPKTTDQNAK